MMKFSLPYQLSCLLFLPLMFTSCNSQLPETTSNQSALSATVTLAEEGASSINSPKVDSVLQFTLMITAMLEDSKGNFWFSSHGDGLCRYDGKQYTYFTVGRGLPNGNVREFAPGPDWNITKAINGGNQISSIQEDNDGYIWIQNGENDICKFNGQAFEVVQAIKESTLSTQLTEAEWKAQRNYLWFGGWNFTALHRYDGRQLERLKFPLVYFANNDAISEIYRDQSENLWFGTMDNGTFRYDGSSFTRINKADEIGICRSVFQDNTGRIWITNNRFGLRYLKGDTLTDFIKDYDSKHLENPRPADFKTSFQSIEQDADGNLWFGTFSSGLWRYDGNTLTHFTENESLPIITVKTIYKDKRGKLWFGIGEGSVYGFDGKSFHRFDATH